MNFDTTIALCVGALFEKRNICIWSKQWLKRRNKFSHTNLLEELALKETDDFKNYCRMIEECFSELLESVARKIQRPNTHMRELISAN